MTDLRNPSRATRRAMVGGTVGLALLSMALVPLGKGSATHLPASAVEKALVFDKVAVVDVETGKLLQDQRVVIEGNRIRTVGASGKVQIPSGAQVIDAHGKYLIPGLWDMHTHSRRYTDFFYPLFIANGVTGIRDAWSEVPIDTTLMWRREILAGTKIGPPRQMLPGPALDESSPCSRGPGEGHVCVADPADARHVVDSLKAAGVDFIKTYQLGRETYFAVASEARRVGLPFGGHLNLGVATAIEASDSGAWILDHINTSGDLYGLCLGRKANVQRCQPVADHFKHSNTWFVPTLIRFATESGDHSMLANLDSMQLVGIGMRSTAASRAILKHFYEFATNFWGGTPFRTGWLHDSTVVAEMAVVPPPGSPADSARFFHVLKLVDMPMMAGTDGGAPVMEPQPPGFALHVELAMFVAEGFTPLQALQAATLNPAKSLHATDSLGTIAPGKLADVVLLDGNPLADITNTTTIRSVVANGRYYDRATLDRLMADAQAKEKTEPRPFGTARAGEINRSWQD